MSWPTRVHLLIQGLDGRCAAQGILLHIRTSFRELLTIQIGVVLRECLLDHRMKAMNHVLARPKDALDPCPLRRQPYPYVPLDRLILERGQACVFESDLVVIPIRLILAESYVSLPLLLLGKLLRRPFLLGLTRGQVEVACLLSVVIARLDLGVQ